MKLLKSKIIDLLESKLNNVGFKYVKKYDGFLKKDDKGWQLYQLLFLEFNEYVEIKPNLLLRINEIEDEFHSISGFEEKFQAGTPTIGISIEKFLKNSECNKKLSMDSNPYYLSEYYFELFKRTGENFLNKYYSITTIADLFVTDEMSELYSGPIFKGFKKLIIANKLGLENYDEIKSFYFDYYTNFSNGYYLKNYTDLIKKIEN
jgi:hypothetical protein